MNFQDELKANVKTQQEKDEEQQQQFYDMLRNCISIIKNDMKDKVANADYTEVDGKQVVSVLEIVPYNLSKCVKQDVVDEDEKAYGLHDHNHGEQSTQELVFSIEYPDGWETYYSELNKLAQKDNINLEPIVLLCGFTITRGDLKRWSRYKTGNKYKIYQISDFPIKVNRQNNDHLYAGGFQLCLKATCEISDHYSDDGYTDVVKFVPEENSTQNIGTFSMDDMDGHDFEDFCADLLSKNGFENVRITQESGDQGIDILAERDGIKYGVQCKNYTGDIGNAAVQQVYAGKDFYKCHVGVVLTNQHFTRAAKELAESNGIILWDRDKLIELLRNAGYELEE